MKNSEIRLHMPAIPYTITRDEYSHDAYTGKVKRFGPMMRSRGFEVYHYGVETSESGATKNFDLLTKKEWRDLRIESIKFVEPNHTHESAVERNDDPRMIINTLSNWSSPLSKEFNKRFKQKLIENYRSTKTDIVCVPLGRTYQDALDKLNVVKVESGIGYNGSFYDFRIFESYSWMSSTLGSENKAPSNYWFIVPNYFDTNEFKLTETPQPKKIGFLGRITDVKGCNIIVEIAKRFPDVEFILCGQGEHEKYTVAPNIKYKLPIHGAERSEYLGSCTAVLCVSKFLEPFCGVSVEAQLCGTPVICSDWGGMSENVEQFKTGLKGRTLADYCLGVQMALDGKFNRLYIRERAVRLFDMYKLAYDYEYAFRSILDVQDLEKNGWYSPDSHILPLLNHTQSQVEARPFNTSAQKKIHKFIPYYGTVPNYFQLYLDSLEINKDILKVYFISDIDLSSYKMPDNFIYIRLDKIHIKNRLSALLYKTYRKDVNPDDLLQNNYKLVDIKILYPILFDDLIKEYDIKETDYVGWGDCDLIYGKISNFLDLKENYGIIGGWHGHFTAIINNDNFKNNFKTIPNYFDIVTDNSKPYGADEIAYREPLKKYLADNNIKMFYINRYFCDIVPPCFYHLSRPNYKDYDNNFYDLYNPTKTIKHLYFDKMNSKLIVTYTNGETRETIYGHLQKRKMELPFSSYENGFLINENSFSL